MSDSPEIIDFLNEALTAELAAINHYFIQAKMCEDWGWTQLAEKFRDESKDEMRDAEVLIDRIMDLNGSPDLQRTDDVPIGRTVEEMLELDHEMEVAALSRYQRGIELCLNKGDAESGETLKTIASSEQEHLDWIKAQQLEISREGIEAYLKKKT